ncbi:phage major capsid protein [Candidatus Nitrospira bockiana]
MPKTTQAEIPNTMPLEELRAKVCEALKAKFPESGYPGLLIEQLFADRVIVRDQEGKLWQYPYTLAEHAVTLGEPTAVMVEYVPARQATGTGDIRLLQAKDKDGWEWEVLIIKPGLGANGQYFPADTLQQAAPLFEGARVFCLDDSQHSRTRDKSAKQIVGWIDQARYVEGRGVVGRLHLLQTADWLRHNLLDSHAERPDLYGLSVDAPGQAITKTIQQAGQSLPVQWFTKILPPVTVDVVWNPGTPGGFQRALNAVQAGATSEEERMKEKLLAILQAKRPDLYAKTDPAAVTEEQLLTLLDEAVPAPASGGTPAQTQQAAALSEADRAVIRQAQVTMWNGQVRELLAESKLPEVMQASLRKRFMDVPGDLAHVKQAIAEERDILAALSQSGRVQGLGYAHDTLVEGEAERLQASMDKLLGADSKSDAPAFRSLRQAYVKITGDVDLAGRPPAGREQYAERMSQAVQSYWRNGIGEPGYEQPGFVRIAQSQNAAAWPTILGNSLYRRLMKDYAAVNYGEDRIISLRRRATDFRTLEAQRLKYAADLPVVDPETADYPEAATLGEEQVSYAVSTRGRLMTVTRKTIINDDLGAVIRLPQREGRAARRTFARFIWNLLISNATYDVDSLAIFHASHGNLGSTALTANAAGITELMAAAQQLMDMTEPGSGEKLGGAYWDARLLLSVPTTLAGTAKQINQSPGIPGAANEGDNPAYGMFGDPEKPERILVNPLFTDANDWYLTRDPQEVDLIEAAFLNGQETPEVFLADQPTVGQMFLADKVQYKIRFEFGADILDFRGGRKAVVA